MRDVKAAALPQAGSRLLVRLMALSVFVVALAGATFAAHAQTGGHAGHHGPGPRGGPDGMMMFGGSPERVDRMLDGLNATDAQRAQVRQIATTAAADLKAQRDASRGMHEQGMAIFTAPTIDASAAESLRQRMVAQHEQASKRMLQAMLDIAKVLTPEQRAKVGERMKDRQATMRDRMQRMQHERAPHGPRSGSAASGPQK